MERVLEKLAEVSGPLALAGLLASLLFYAVRAILRARLIPALPRREAQLVVLSIINKFFILSLVALVLGSVVYVIERLATPSNVSGFSGSQTPGHMTSPPEASELITPVVRITDFPRDAGDLTSEGKGRIRGMVENLPNPRQYKIVIYAYTNMWYVQPTEAEPLTEIMNDGTWRNWTHLGSSYVALVIRPPYSPLRKTEALPATGGAIIAKSEWSGG